MADVDELRRQVAEKTQAPADQYGAALVALANALPSCEERAQRFAEAAQLYLDKFGNQAEAIRYYERALESDPSMPSALAYLERAYHQRRDWARLLAVRERASETLPGSTRLDVLRQNARLASKRLPDSAPELWERVLELAPEDDEARQALDSLRHASSESSLWKRLTQWLDRG